MQSKALALAVALHASAALARPSAALVYERSAGTESCPDEAGLRTRVTTRLGFDPFAPTAAVRVEATVTRVLDRFRGSVRALDEQANVRGERQLDAASCTELVEAMAVTISILLDPRSFAPSNSGRSAELPAPSTLDSPIARERSPDQRPERQDHAGAVPSLAPAKLRLVRVGAEMVGSLGAAPAAAAGAAALIGVETGSWSLDLEGRIDLPAESTRSDGTGVRSSLLLALLVPCVHRGWFLACPVVALGALSGEGVNVGAPRRDATFYAAFGLRAGLEAPLGGPFALRVHGDLGAPVTRTTLNDRGQEVWTTPVLFASAALGLVARFP